MRRFLLKSCLVLTLGPQCAIAEQPLFSGTWTIDLRSTRERKQKEECGSAAFELKRKGDKIVGSHQMATVGCGRLNDGGEGTVKGIVVGQTAVLVVTSGRNGAVVLGRATLKGRALVWETLEDITPGDPPSDSPLILGQGRLQRVGK
jgi:hypothetical protein